MLRVLTIEGGGGGCKEETWGGGGGCKEETLLQVDRTVCSFNLHSYRYAYAHSIVISSTGLGTRAVSRI